MIDIDMNRSLPGTDLNKRTDTYSGIIVSSPQIIYRAFLDRGAVAKWRPPKGMKCHIYEFDPRVRGAFRMSFYYSDSDHEVAGKTSEHADVFHGRFLDLIPDKRIVELVEFESNDPAFAGEMTITTTLTPVSGGTEVTFIAENPPPGIRPGDHQKGMISTMENLAEYIKTLRV